MNNTYLRRLIVCSALLFFPLVTHAGAVLNTNFPLIPGGTPLAIPVGNVFANASNFAWKSSWDNDWDSPIKVTYQYSLTELDTFAYSGDREH